MNYILKPIKTAIQYIVTRYKINSNIENNTINNNHSTKNNPDENKIADTLSNIYYNSYNFLELNGKIDDIDLSLFGDTFFVRIPIHSSSIIMYSFVIGVKTMQDKIIIRIDKHKDCCDLYLNDNTYYWYPKYKCVLGPSKIIKNFFNSDIIFVEYKNPSTC